MNHDDAYPDSYLREILTQARTIAVVGASPRPQRPSHGVMRFLQRQGYRTIPVNPFACDGDGEILGERCYARLADVPEPIDMVDIFRRSEMAGAAVDEAITIGQNRVDAARRYRRRGGGAGRGERDQGGDEPLPGDPDPAIGLAQA
jgi:predicted CoA-binding protein